jgi:hypothetical protein
MSHGAGYKSVAMPTASTAEPKKHSSQSDRACHRFSIPFFNPKMYQKDAPAINLA